MTAQRKRESHIFEREEHDHYVEEDWVSKRLFEVEDFGGNGALVVDPACGWQRIPFNAKRAGYTARASDIVDRRIGELDGIEFRMLDFMGLGSEEIYEFWRGHGRGLSNRSSIVCNPPFNAIGEFFDRAIALATLKVAFVFPTRRLAAAHWLTVTPLYRIWFLTPRPSMPTGAHIEAGGKVGGGTQDYCWLVWLKGYDGAPTTHWLHRNRKL